MQDADDIVLEIEDTTTTSAGAQYPEQAHPKSAIPAELSTLSGSATEEEDAEANAKFSEFYLTAMTKGFGEDLDQLRESKDFVAQSSMPLLIRALKEGINMFDQDQRQFILSGAAVN